jgi:LPS export ABC transporter permease LptG/LPS export ABC transporter permease LptF
VRVDVKIIDRYLIREILPPFLLALGLFTFLLAINPMLEKAQLLLAKGVDLPTVGFMLAMLLPQALGVTLPMALLAGLLMGLGRLSGDREAVALLACGVSPFRLLRVVLLLATVVGVADMYVLTTLVPDSNQRFRDESYRLIAKMGENDIKPGVFYEGFPGKVLRVQDVRPEGGWRGVLLAETADGTGRPTITLAREGALDLDPVNRQVSIVLRGRPVSYVAGGEEGTYDISPSSELRFRIPADSVFGDGNMMPRGRAEMTIADLREAEAAKMAQGAGMTTAQMFEVGLSTHPEVLQRHQMFSFPLACLVFALIGVALGLHTRREGKLGGFTLGLVVICAYYGVMAVFENLTKGGQFPAVWTRWMPNIIIGLVGAFALRARARSAGEGLTIPLPSWLTRLPSYLRARPADAVAGTQRLTRGDRIVIVVRIPHVALPRPRILDRYVSGQYLRVAALSFVGLLALYYIGTFLDKSEGLFKGRASGPDLLKYFVYSTPQFIVHLAPMATLVAVLATIGGLARTGELKVMLACGVSLYRVAAPLVLLALVWSGGLFLLDDRVLAHANRRAEILEDEIRGIQPQAINTVVSANWHAGADGRVYYAVAFDRSSGTLHGLSVYDPTADGSRLSSHTFARQATFANGVWHARAGWVQRFPTAERSLREALPVGQLRLMPPERFSGQASQDAELMTFGDLRKYISERGQSGLNLVESHVRLHERLAFPFVTVVMTLLGVPFGISTGRRGALYGVGLAIILGVGYWLLNTFFLAVGNADRLAPPLAAWAANALFLAVGLYATLTVRT